MVSAEVVVVFLDERYAPVRLPEDFKRLAQQLLELRGLCAGNTNPQWQVALGKPRLFYDTSQHRQRHCQQQLNHTRLYIMILPSKTLDILWFAVMFSGTQCLCVTCVFVGHVFSTIAPRCRCKPSKCHYASFWVTPASFEMMHSPCTSNHVAWHAKQVIHTVWHT